MTNDRKNSNIKCVLLTQYMAHNAVQVNISCQNNHHNTTKYKWKNINKIKIFLFLHQKRLPVSGSLANDSSLLRLSIST